MLPLGMPHVIRQLQGLAIGACQEHVCVDSSPMSNFNERMASRVGVCADLTVPLRKRLTRLFSLHWHPEMEVHIVVRESR